MASNPAIRYLAAMLEVQGQSRALAQLQRAMAAARLSHTWLFAGPPGVGKFTLAAALAKTMLCPRRQTLPNGDDGGVRLPQLPADFQLRVACGVCESCRAVDAGAHPDLHVITKELTRFHDTSGKSKATTLSIDLIRGEITGNSKENVEAKIYKKSFYGHGKWFIIDQADLMLPHAQNALLKVLEEPPPETYLVMIATSPQELLQTIRSRSQIVVFNELSDEVIVRSLLGRSLDNDDARMLARLSHGSLGRALQWVDDLAAIAQENSGAARKNTKGDQEAEPQFTPAGILGWMRTLSQSLDELIAGRRGGTQVAAVLGELSAEYAQLALLRDPLTSKDRATRDGIALLLGIVADYFSDRLRAAIGAPNAIPLPSRSGGLDPDVAEALLACAREAEAQVDMNAHIATVLAATCTQWELLLRVG